MPIVTNSDLDILTVDRDKEWPPLDPRAEAAQPLLKRSMGRFYPARGPIDERNQALLGWIQERRSSGLWPYGLCQLGPVGTHAQVKHPSGVVLEGINLTTVDYLGLAQDSRLKDAAIRAIEDHGFHTPSSGPLMGNTLASYDLERDIAKLLNRGDSFLCPTGWAAGFAAISGLVRPDDIVVMDELAHQCLQQGAYASTPNVQTFKHLDNNDLESQLRAIRESNTTSAIMVVTEGLFSMDGDAPDLRGLTSLCQRYGALSLVDIAHDFGSTGPRGSGTIGAQGVEQDVDIIVGSFSKSLGTNGGFIASKTLAEQWTQLCFGGPYTFSTTVSPIQVAVASEALRLVSGAEGDVLRARLLDNVTHARAAAVERKLTVLGAPSPIVPVLIGREQHSRLAGLLSFKKGLIATCLEFPVVQRGAARYRLSMSPRLTFAEIDRALDIIAESIAEANAALD